MIAVTGANGLLGSFIVRKLLDQKKQVVALKRVQSDTSLLADISHSLHWRDVDLNDTDSLHNALQGVTQVIHAAALVSFNPARRKELQQINVDGTQNIVNICLQSNIKRLAFISSVAALGRQKNQSLIDETNTWTESSLNSYYAESKYLAELEVWRGQEEGLETVIVNPSVILAPTDWNKSSAQLFKYVWQEKPFYTDAFLNYVDVRDVAQITVQLIESATQGERFILNAGKIPFRDFFGRVAERFGKKAPSVKLGKTTLQLAAQLEKVRSQITGSEPLITSETAKLAGTSFFYQNEKVRKKLNFEFQSLDSTLDWCCQYYLKKFSTKN